MRKEAAGPASGPTHAGVILAIPHTGDHNINNDNDEGKVIPQRQTIQKLQLALGETKAPHNQPNTMQDISGQHGGMRAEDTARRRSPQLTKQQRGWSKRCGKHQQEEG